jgi:gliding motility-associated-like protein
MFFPFVLFSQEDEISLQRQVIGASGQSFQNSSLMISTTVGEAVIGGATEDNLTLNQGFQQATNVSLAAISFDYNVKKETCPDSKNGQISLFNFAGCDNGNYVVEWEDGSSGYQLSNLSSGWYHFSILSCGVVSSDSIFVGLIYENNCELVFYTAFSPNGDGVNDTWVIDNINTEPNNINTVVIFDLWGNIVEEFTNYDNAGVVWNGKDAKGKDATEGTFYYQVKINTDSYSGYIELTR